MSAVPQSMGATSLDRRIQMLPLADPAHLDYVAISAHKMYAPYGTGALIGPVAIFEQGDPDVVGGGTVDIVTEDDVRRAGPPDRDEAGSPNVVGAVALAQAAWRVYEDFAGYLDDREADCGLNRCGYLIAAPPGERAAALAAALETQRGFAIDAETIDAKTARQLLPIARFDEAELIGHEPDAGFADAYLVTSAFARNARRLGVTVREGVAATGLRLAGGRDARRLPGSRGPARKGGTRPTGPQGRTPRIARPAEAIDPSRPVVLGEFPTRGASLSPAAILDLARGAGYRAALAWSALAEDRATDAGALSGIYGEIDRLEAEIAPLTKFILPGGSEAAARAHLARCVCRRAERAVVRLMRTEPSESFVLQYLNRLSDYLFVLARWLNHQANVIEHDWTSRGGEEGRQGRGGPGQVS